MDSRGPLVVAILVSVQLSAAAADERYFTDSQKYSQFYTTQDLTHYSSHVVRGLVQCTSKCYSEPDLECVGFRLDKTNRSHAECFLYDQLDKALLKTSASPGSDIVYAIEGAGSSCPNGYYLNPYANTCIRLIMERKSWQGAKANCESSGEYLATFPTTNDMRWFDDFRINGEMTASLNGNAMWIGLNVIDSQWQWHGLSTALLSASDSRWNEALEEPDLTDDGCGCVSSTGENNGLFDMPCSNLYYSICELA